MSSLTAAAEPWRKFQVAPPSAAAGGAGSSAEGAAAVERCSGIVERERERKCESEKESAE